MCQKIYTVVGDRTVRVDESSVEFRSLEVLEVDCAMKTVKYLDQEV